MTYTITGPSQACGQRVEARNGDLLGFCEKGESHDGPHSHLFSDFRVWWVGSGRLRGREGTEPQ